MKKAAAEGATARGFPGRRLHWRRALVLLLAAASLVYLCGFAPLPRKVFAKWLKASPKAFKSLRVDFGARTGWLYLGTSSSPHRLQLDDGASFADPGPETPTGGEASAEARSLAALWRFLDFYSLRDPDSLADSLAMAGVDLNKRGWIRLGEDVSSLAETIGAAGESEPDAPQVWFSKESSVLLRLSLGPGSLAVPGPPGPGGFPQWIALGETGLKLKPLP